MYHGATAAVPHRAAADGISPAPAATVYYAPLGPFPAGADPIPRETSMPRVPNLFSTAYGHFSADGTEYVITRPDTPKPWVNVICPGDYGTVISQGGSGYSWKTHATLNRVNRWEQDLVRDDWGKYLYCRDRADKAFWSLTWQPVQATTRSSWRTWSRAGVTR